MSGKIGENRLGWFEHMLREVDNDEIAKKIGVKQE